MRFLGAIAGLSVILLVWANWEGRDFIDARADKVLVVKSERRLILLQGEKPLRTYRVSLGRHPIGHKEQEGDGRTPEGFYRIDFRKSESAFHRALHISYPNLNDTTSARGRGRNPGGAIMIHGIRNGFGWTGKLHRLLDWTSGCIAVTNWEIEEIWRAVPNGIPIEIRP